MTVALSDTKLLCDMLQPLPDFTDSIATANQTAEFYTKRKPLSATINTLANALYKVSPFYCEGHGECSVPQPSSGSGSTLQKNAMPISQSMKP